MGGSHSRRGLRKKLRGGAYVGNGSFKCVVDAVDDMPCRQGHELKKLLHPENYVKIVLPRTEYEAEIKIKNDLVDVFKEEASRLFVFMSDDVCQYKESRFPDLTVGNKVLKFCDTEYNETGLDLVVTYCERGRPFVSYGKDEKVNVASFNLLWFMDVAYALYQLSLKKYMHADAKPLNMLVSHGVGKLIDFGFLRQYDDLANFDYTELWRDELYPYWPAVFANLVQDGVTTPKIVSEDARTEVFESVDKHSLAVGLIYDTYSWTRKRPDWSLFKDLRGSRREYVCDSVDLSDENIVFDSHYNLPFYSWPTIFENLRAFFKQYYEVDTPVLDTNYLSARQAMIDSVRLSSNIARGVANHDENHDDDNDDDQDESDDDQHEDEDEDDDDFDEHDTRVASSPNTSRGLGSVSLTHQKSQIVPKASYNPGNNSTSNESSRASKARTIRQAGSSNINDQHSSRTLLSTQVVSGSGRKRKTDGGNVPPPKRLT